MSRSRHGIGPVSILLGAALSLLIAACRPVPIGPRGDVGSDCSAIDWGSLASVVRDVGSGPLTDVRAGTHECFDRLVIEFESPNPPGWVIGYVDKVRAPGSGAEVPLRGGAELRVVLRAPAYDARFRPAYDPPTPREAVDVSGFESFRQVAFAGSFEAQSRIGIGVRARLPFRVLTLEGPTGISRIVIDVAHRWG